MRWALALQVATLLFCVSINVASAKNVALLIGV